MSMYLLHFWFKLAYFSFSKVIRDGHSGKGL